MPLIFKILGYGGNALLFVFGLFGLASGDGAWLGAAMAGLGALNLYLVRKIDVFSREEVWLQTEMRKRELRREIEEFDAEEAARHAAPKQITSARGKPE